MSSFNSQILALKRENESLQLKIRKHRCRIISNSDTCLQFAYIRCTELHIDQT